MKSDVGDVFGEIPAFVYALICLVFEFLLSHLIIGAFESTVSGPLAVLLFGIIVFGTTVVFIADLWSLTGKYVRG